MSWKDMLRPRTGLILLVVGGVTAGAWLARAAVDNTVSAGTLPYHGVLQRGGQPVTGSVDFCFRLFDGTTPVWAEKQTLTVTQGAFSARLGAVTPLTDAAAQSNNLYLEISVVDSSISGPRTCDTSSTPSSDYAVLTTQQRLGSVAYALQAAHATTADSALALNEYTYAKVLMRAAYLPGAWPVYVAGPAGQTCNTICQALSKGADSCSSSTHPLSCAAEWCEGQGVSHSTPPYLEPYFGYGCGVTCTTHGPRTLCMCSEGACAWSDAAFTLPNANYSFW